MSHKNVKPSVPDHLQFKRQICFPLYSASNAVVRAYRPYLDELKITYLQYMVLMVLWEEQASNVKTLGERLNLDSGTLTPLLKRLEAKGFISRQRDKTDERGRIIRITQSGNALKSLAKDIPTKVAKKTGLTIEEHQQLKTLCLKIVANSQ
ncbi:MarR family transcriptional regulator [Aliikangiella marina]|uniref:MarR family transcriptional regulator n=1 Tax=Aliikangiella marina TaxID=1712262 RepID=A0A545T598_9GAMM|nr:MarR family transcriptional regulator [Aliikangiella marina]TQV72355.1 MarR family transcriptional regulator [Aliikangiella marina]